MLQRYTLEQIQRAAECLRAGGIVAYPTEAVYGLGCDPQHRDAFAKLLALKQRPFAQGVLLIAADMEQIMAYIDISMVPAPIMQRVQAAWPGPTTWVLPCAANVPAWITGDHSGIAVRVTAHAPAAMLCRAFGGALVSTSANPHGALPARSAQAVMAYFDGNLDGLLDAPLGDQPRPTVIRDALSGAVIRA